MTDHSEPCSLEIDVVQRFMKLQEAAKAINCRIRVNPDRNTFVLLQEDGTGIATPVFEAQVLAPFTSFMRGYEAGKLSKNKL